MAPNPFVASETLMWQPDVLPSTTTTASTTTIPPSTTTTDYRDFDSDDLKWFAVFGTFGGIAIYILAFCGTHLVLNKARKNVWGKRAVCLYFLISTLLSITFVVTFTILALTHPDDRELFFVSTRLAAASALYLSVMLVLLLLMSYSVLCQLRRNDDDNNNGLRGAFSAFWERHVMESESGSGSRVDTAGLPDRFKPSEVDLPSYEEVMAGGGGMDKVENEQSDDLDSQQEQQPPPPVYEEARD